MSTCPKCGTTYPPTVRICTKDGMVLDADAVQDPQVARFLFADPRAAALWLPVRLFVGWDFLEAGLHKFSQAFFGQHSQHPDKDPAVCLDIDQPTCSRDGRMIRNHLVQAESLGACGDAWDQECSHCHPIP